MSPRLTSRRYDRPHRPWPVRIANQLLRPLGRRGPLSLAPEGLIRAARRAEGLHDFGPPEVDDTLALLTRSIEREARLTPVGRAITRVRLVSLLRNRLRLEALLTAHPQIRSTPIPAPIVITGLQRTGTTLLHRLLAADPRTRSLRSWEAVSPTPYPGAPTGPDDPRRREAERAERALAYLAPDFFAVHPVDAHGVEEEVVLMDLSLRSTVPEATMRVPSFSAWLEQADPLPAYHLLARCLQVLQHAEPGERWVLKTPHHLEYLDALLTVFPDAVIVHTHRDPVVTVGSFCSMVAHAYGVFSDDVDPHEVGRTWLRKVGRMMDRALDVRDARPDARVVDVPYDTLVADPVATAQRVLDAAGLPPSEASTAAMRAAREVQDPHRHGKHVYDLGDFGLTPDDVADRFSRYRSRFGFA